MGSRRRGAHERHPLALPARELGWIAIETLGGKVGHFDQGIELGADAIGRASHLAGQKRDVIPRAHMREKAAVLDDVADTAPYIAHILWRDRLGIEEDLARIGGDEPDKEAQAGGFAAPARADESGGLARLYVQAHVADDLELAKRFLDVFQLKHDRGRDSFVHRFWAAPLERKPPLLWRHSSTPDLPSTCSARAMIPAIMQRVYRRARVAVFAAMVCLMACLALYLAGCLTVGYVAQAGLGQLRLLHDARPIAEVLRDPEVDLRTKALLAEVPDMLAFAEKNGLDSQGNYRKYVELSQESVVWFMAASDPLAFEPEVWSFPIVGSFTYVGWFNKDEALTIKKILAGRGLDVHVRTVSAYSTGGWFRDPILSSMLSDEDDAFRSLAHVLIHELVHANILVNDQSTFNESIAKFVGDTMAEQYMVRRFGAESEEVVSFREELAERRERGQRLTRAYSELNALYESNVPREQKLAQKQRILDSVRSELKLLSRLNNASLLSFKTYNAGLAEFGQLYEVCGKDWRRFLAAAASLEPSAFAEEQMDEIGPVIAALAAKGCPAAGSGAVGTGQKNQRESRPPPAHTFNIASAIEQVGSECAARSHRIPISSM